MLQNQTQGYVQVGQAVDKQVTALDELCHQLDKLDAEFHDNARRLLDLANRSLGPEPQGPSVESKPQSEPHGQIALIVTKLAALGQVADFQRSQISRIERVL